jgi:hypothetical protein
MSLEDQRVLNRCIVHGEVTTEVKKACDKWPPFNSVHEGYAVIMEELDELWQEVKRKVPNNQAMRKEAIQVAAMAIRFAAELTEENEE